MSSRVIVALDAPSAPAALSLVDRIGPACTFYKVGLELFAAAGPAVVRTLQDRGKEVFLDLKLHDIPNTVAGAAARAGELGARFITVHALGGERMVAAAARAAPDALAVLAVTVLTSHDAGSLGSVLGRAVADVAAEADRLAAMAVAAGAQGVVCAATDAARVRKAVGPRAFIVTPGIRMPGEPRHDQRRVRAPAEAFAAGATHIVAGRSVTAAPDPAAAFARIAADAGA